MAMTLSGGFLKVKRTWGANDASRDRTGERNVDANLECQV